MIEAAILVSSQTHTFDDVRSIIQCVKSRHICVLVEGYSHKLICDTYFRNAELSITSSLSLVMVINLFGHNKMNISTLKFVKWSVNQVKYIKCTIFAVLQ